MTTTLDLFDVLDAAGIDNLKAGTKEISGSCPGHQARTGHADRHPSWSMSQQSLTHHCFSCGYGGTLSQLLTDLGHPPGPDLEMELKQQSFLRRLAERDAEAIVAPAAPVLTDWALIHLLDDVPDRLLAIRQVMRSAIDFYGVRWDADHRCWVLPIRDPYGTLLGAQYRQKGSVSTQPPGLTKSETLFGLSHVRSYDHVVLVESPLDSIRLFGLGIPSVAALGSWVSDQQAKLLARTYSRVYLALDNDSAGEQGNSSLFTKLRHLGTAPVRWVYNSKVKDPGEYDTDDDLWRDWQLTLRFGM